MDTALLNSQTINYNQFFSNALTTLYTVFYNPNFHNSASERTVEGWKSDVLLRGSPPQYFDPVWHLKTI